MQGMYPDEGFDENGNLIQSPMQNTGMYQQQQQQTYPGSPYMGNPMEQPPAGPEGFFKNLWNNFSGGTPEQQAYYQQRGLINPIAARAGAFHDRAKNWGPNERGGMSPVMAYQQAVAKNAATRQSRATSDPYYEFEEGKRRGHLDPEMSWAEYQQSKYRLGATGTSNMRDFAQWQQLNPQKEGETDEEYRERASSAFNNMVNRPITWGTGPGTMAITSGVTPGDTVEVGNTDTTISREVDLAGGVKNAQVWAAADQAFETGFNQTSGALQRSINTIGEMINYIDANPNMDTGMIEGYVTTKTDPLIAYLDTLSTQLTIPALAAAKLNPVTEQEFDSIKSTFLSALKDPVANRASLVATMQWMTGIAEEMQSRQEYYAENGSLRGYSTSFKFDLPEVPQLKGKDIKDPKGSDKVDF